MSIVLIVCLIFYLFGVVYTVAVYITYNMGNRDLPDIVWRVIFEGNLFLDILKNPSSLKVNSW